MKRFSSHVWRNLLSSVLLVGANAGFSLLTFALTLLIARRLGTAGYGAVMAVLSFSAVLCALFPALILASAKSVALRLNGNPAAPWQVFRSACIKTALLFIPLLGLILAAAKPVAAFLKLPGSSMISWAVLFVGASLALALARGTLEGAQRFVALSLNVLAEGVLRFGLGLLFLFWLVDSEGILWAYTAAAILPVFMALPVLFPAGGKPRAPAAEFLLSRELGLMLTVHLLIETGANADMIAVKHYFSPADAGVYSVVFSAGKFMLFAAQAITAVMFPQVVAARQRGENQMPVTRDTALFLLAAGLGFVAVSFLAAAPLIRLLFGPDYLPAATLLGPYSLGILAFSFLLYFTRYFIACGHYGFLGALIPGALAEGALFLLYHPSLKAIVWEFAGVNALLTAVIIGAGLRRIGADARQSPNSVFLQQETEGVEVS